MSTSLVNHNHRDGASSWNYIDLKIRLMKPPTYGRTLGYGAEMGHPRIESVIAAEVKDPRLLGRADALEADWHDQIDHMNPLASDGRYAGQAARFAPPWGETICVVTSDDGQFGVGMTALAGVTVPLINDYLAPMLVDDDAADVERLWDMMATACGAHFGVSGVASYAISAVDLALWDLRGKHAGRPVHELIGGAGLRPLRCYATGMNIDHYQELGFEAFKLACLWGPDTSEAVGRTIELLGQSREHVGVDAPLMLDCWGIHSAEEAVVLGEAVAPYQLGWIEDYIFPDDWTGYRTVRERLPDSVLAAGERWHTDRPFGRAITEGWLDVLQPDALWVGGATPTIRIAQLAAEAGTGLAIHCGGNDSYGQHLAYALPGSEWAEFYIGSAVGTSLLDSYRSTPGMALPVDGYLTPTDAPGFGVELTMNDINRAV